MKRRDFLSAAAVTVAATGLSVELAGPASAGPPPDRGWNGKVQTGFDVLAGDHYRLLSGKKVGFISNPTAVTRELDHEVDVMHASSDVTVGAVFGPEHGFRGTAQAGGAEGFFSDPATGLPVYSLYGAGIAETVDTFTASGIEVAVFDIQDVGTRFYTYIWTMYRSMAAAAIMGLPFVVLDRPNPLGGRAALGPVLHPEFSSGVGVKPIAQQHGMTVGELAQLFNDQFVPDDAGGKRADLTVVEMRGWRRGQYFDQTGVPWVMPSPNMPTLDTALVYPGFGMFEGTNFAEGRGTTRPFELVGAPYGDYRLHQALAAQHIPGAGFRENYFVPTFSKYSNPSSTVGGVQVYVTDRDAFDPIRAAVAVMVTARQVYPDDWSFDGYRLDGGPAFAHDWVDYLSGSEWIRTAVTSGLSTDEVVAGWQDELAQFAALREKFLIYRKGQ
ncbi:MAG TPA: DUF1343 domain-containing protein [Nakamurella sp.]|jgi:uncharacterized protein YbbC (DUF1343 family)|nr:DUF1343 domain-containing protein [Nakamurella sp.]